MASLQKPSPDEWFDTFVRQQQAPLLAYARSLVRNDTVAQDIVQDTFLRLWKNRPDPVFVRAWLYRVCRTRAIDWWRKQNALPLADTGGDDDNPCDFFEQLPDAAPQPDATLEHAETVAALLREVETLPKRQRELVRLKFQSELSYREIADTTGLSVTNVGFILHTALTTLREKMTATPRRL